MFESLAHLRATGPRPWCLPPAGDGVFQQLWSAHRPAICRTGWQTVGGDELGGSTLRFHQHVGAVRSHGWLTVIPHRAGCRIFGYAARRTARGSIRTFGTHVLGPSALLGETVRCNLG